MTVRWQDCIEERKDVMLQTIGSNYVYDADIRDYNLWMQEKFPGVLVLFDALLRRAYWLEVNTPRDNGR